MHRIILSASIFIMIANPLSAQKYIFYLHGKIVEDKGAKAVSLYFGTYEYEPILDAFRKAGFIVISEVRKPNTEVVSYAHHLAAAIDSLISKGVEAKRITVVGASKGAVIAMYVSTFLKSREVNYVFLAACNDGNFESFADIRFYGNILSIYEKSDDIGESCTKFKAISSANINHYKEIEIHTGLHHGFLFQPLPEWMNPSIAWANEEYD